MEESIQTNAPYPGADIKTYMQLEKWCTDNNVLYCTTDEFQIALKRKAIRPIPNDQLRYVGRLALEFHNKLEILQPFSSHWVFDFLLKDTKLKQVQLQEGYNLKVMQYLSKGGYIEAICDIQNILKKDQIDSDI